jgi:hypothetical protein
MGKICFAFLFVSLAGGCSSMREGTTGNVQSDVLTAEEIATTDAQNAYDAISLKRPFFLKSRIHNAPSGKTAGYPVVYMDRIYYGDLESLRNISVATIKEIRYLDSNAATVEFGAGRSGGILMVLTKR